MGSHSYLQNMCSGSACNQMHYLQLYSVPHLQQLYQGATHDQVEPSYLQNLPLNIKLTQAQAQAIENKFDKLDIDGDARISANTRLTAAQKEKMISGLDAVDAKLHTFIDAHTISDPALQQLYCTWTHIGDCFWN